MQSPSPAALAAIRERWSEVEALLDEATTQPPAERDAWLSRNARDEPLRAAVQTLLARLDGALPADRLLAVSGDPDLALRLDDIGPYRVLQRLGAGGMGTVFLAERALAGGSQRVALKLLREGIYEPALQRLFQREQQILARLEHPGIARLIDAGFTAANVPWFAMEYVDGAALDDWCARHAPSRDDRLRLFLQVCDAVAFAHRNLVVHRDLKPANILVDGEGHARLLDFGIARPLDDGEDATQTQQRRLTPRYAAPEQLGGGPVTPATDVYALGVILHELLTGAPLQTTPDGAQPVRHPALRGDLEPVLRQALRRDPAQRYAGAAELGDDLRRVLAQLPVRARPDAFAYRAARFLRRHRLAVGAAAAVAVALAVATWVSVAQARRAEEQAARALRSKDFLISLFQEITPFGARGGTELRAHELMAMAAQRAERELAADPAAQAEVIVTSARVLARLGQQDAALRILEPALQRFEAAGDDVALAHALAARAAGLLGRDDARAEADARRALQLYLSAGPRNTARDLRAWFPRTTLAALARKRGDFAGALALQLENLEEARPLGDSLDLAIVLESAVGDLIELDRLDEAEARTREALAMALRHRPPDHLLPMRLEATLGLIGLRRGDLEAAVPRLERWVAWSAEHEAFDESRQLRALNALAEAYAQLGRYADAEARIQAAERILAKARPPRVAPGELARARLAAAQGEHARALAHFEAAAAAFAREAGDPSEALAGTLAEAAEAARLADRGDAAQALAKRAADQLAALPRVRSATRAAVLEAQGFAHWQRGETAAARAALREALALRAAVAPEGMPARRLGARAAALGVELGPP